MKHIQNLFIFAPQPLPEKTVMWFLAGTLILISLATGYYHSALKIEQRKYRQLEEKYATVKSQLLEYQTLDTLEE